MDALLGRLADLLDVVAVADGRHLDGRLELAVIDIGARHVAGVRVEPIRLTDMVGRRVGDGFGPLGSREVDRDQVRILNFRILDLVDFGLMVGRRVHQERKGGLLVEHFLSHGWFRSPYRCETRTWTRSPSVSASVS